MIAIDPVCKMKVETETAQWNSDYKGETYYFCAPGCMRSFKKDPEKYLSGGGVIHMDHDHNEHDHNDHDHHDHDHHDHHH